MTLNFVKGRAQYREGVLYTCGKNDMARGALGKNWFICRCTHTIEMFSCAIFFIVGTTAVGSFENGVIPTHMLGDTIWGLVLRRWAYWGPSKTIFEESSRGAATWASTKAHSSWCRYTTVLWPFTRRVALISAWQQDTDQYTVPRECGGWSWRERIHACCLVGDVGQMATCVVRLG